MAEKEYIEREAVIEAVTSWYKKSCMPENMSSYNMGERAAYTTAISEISELHAADVQPVVHGKWKERRFSENVHGVECSVCHTTWDTVTDYCPFCGAEMG